MQPHRLEQLLHRLKGAETIRWRTVFACALSAVCLLALSGHAVAVDTLSLLGEPAVEEKAPSQAKLPPAPLPVKTSAQTSEKAADLSPFLGLMDEANDKKAERAASNMASKPSVTAAPATLPLKTETKPVAKTAPAPAPSVMSGHMAKDLPPPPPPTFAHNGWPVQGNTAIETMQDHGEEYKAASGLAGYKVGTGDKLRVSVYGEPDISNTYVIDGKGQISLPLAGSVTVTGKTLPQVERALAAALARGYLLNPNVSIQIAEYRPFYIMGEVRRPGSYNYIEGMNVLNAVAVGGGFTYRAKTSKVDIVREGVSYDEPLTAKPNAPIMPGDIITINERFF